MNRLTDQQLLREYAGPRWEAAFAELVRRHVDFVHSAAVRMVCDVHLAEDVTQSVFAALAQNARQLTEHPVLSGWLHRTAQNLAANVVRSEVRRRAREQEAVAMNELLAAEPDARWEDIAPQLDAALGELGEADRDALLLRYFEHKSAPEMAAVLGISTEAAQKRVTRAVERLRELFSQRNVTIGASGLVAAITANAVQAAPVGLAAAISTAVALTTTTIGMTMIHKILIAGFAAAAIGSGIYAVHLQGQIGVLQQQQMSLDQQIEQLGQERDDAKNRLAAAQRENKQLQSNENELLKLRGQVDVLRQRQNVSSQATQTATNNLSPTERKSILVATTFVSIPADDLQSLGVEWASNARGDRVGLLTAQQYKTIFEAMKGASDVNIMNSPRAITLNGETAAMSVSRAVPLAGTNADVGLTLQVTPFYSTNSSTFDLTLNVELRELTGDPSAPDLQAIQMTNKMNVTSGQIAVLEQDILSGGWWPDSTNVSAGPRSLLVFVTPTVVNSRDFERPGPRPGTMQRVAGIWGSPTNFDERGLPKSQ